MDGFVYMGILSRIEHYEQIARKTASERRNKGSSRLQTAKVVAAVRPIDPVRLPERKSA
jgi:hypothetical protein